MYASFWYFAAERQRIFFRRLEGQPPPWTQDKILLRYKFTNAYRASDRISQYLIKHVIYEGDPDPRESLFRILLFKVFNRVETWELLRANVGEVCLATYHFKHYDDVLTQALERGERIFSAAYIMPSGGGGGEYSRKHRYFLKVLEMMLADDLPEKLRDCSSMRAAYLLLRSYPMIGDFLAYQYVTDLNYSPLTNFSEMEFVMPGPGARDGIRKCFRDFGELDETDVIRYVTDRQEEETDRWGLRFETLWGRPLQLIDVQNLFCEISKYAREAYPEVRGVNGRTRIKQGFRPSTAAYSCPMYPPKWNLNGLIHEDTRINGNREAV